MTTDNERANSVISGISDQQLSLAVSRAAEQRRRRLMALALPRTCCCAGRHVEADSCRKCESLQLVLRWYSGPALLLLLRVKGRRVKV